ncbi:hypothetical protein SERLA73DRAFT_145380 [Serpula lacrymans var. lacrymans S7.3]|uniref:Uncharacterized protein n=2 Tax=Serpula lacrymans var. lacrymans TaxID=341189 RepID=F8QDM9_SERL3|nr:uncharacterized protein SERLADRAFT_453975 [Serpula lacrymans var. lacrymans S7.9]EGN93700.1 hypothetical protein SERLA73DRAFT_145380 [Serpula lacrymans var. lacrymans S7.3]EGO19070.1 hypothetical protein SERLADRAFT_453975 [Serpula lacrymans var. lacrymans S7.9]
MFKVPSTGIISVNRQLRSFNISEELPILESSNVLKDSAQERRRENDRTVLPSNGFDMTLHILRVLDARPVSHNMVSVYIEEFSGLTFRLGQTEVSLTFN